MKCLVTGGAGFIGSNLAGRLLADGHEVHILDNLSTGKRANLPASATFHELDLNSAEAAQLIEQQGFEVIFHQAAQVMVNVSVREPQRDANINILGSLNLLEAARKSGSRPAIIFASSGGTVYGEASEPPYNESHPLHPISPYGIAKASVEFYLGFYAQVHGLRSVALRYANVYGPRQDSFGEAGVVAIFIRKLLAGEQPVINGDGRQVRDFVYVDDVVAANLAALDPKLQGGYNVGTGIPTDINAVFNELTTLTGSNLPEQHGPEKPGEIRYSLLENAKLRADAGWEPQVSFREGLAQTLAWFRQTEQVS